MKGLLTWMAVGGFAICLLGCGDKPAPKQNKESSGGDKVDLGQSGSDSDMTEDENKKAGEAEKGKAGDADHTGGPAITPPSTNDPAPAEGGGDAKPAESGEKTKGPVDDTTDDKDEEDQE